MPKSIHDQLRAKIALSDQRIQDHLTTWKENREYRLGRHPRRSEDDPARANPQTGRHRVAIQADWSLTKTKQAFLFSQMPEVRGTTKHSAYAPAVPIFMRRVNERLADARVAAEMDLACGDVISTSGTAAMLVTYESIQDIVQVPAVDPLTLPPGTPVPMTEMPRVVDRRFLWRRVDPKDLILDVNYTGADWNQASFIGHHGRIERAEAQRIFKLSAKQLDRASGESQRERISSDDKETRDESSLITYAEIWYWRHRFHPDERSYTAIQHVVYIDGIEKPVVDEPWKGQRIHPDSRTYLGVCQFPLQVVRLTQISDTPLPPSDTEMGRPYVDELSVGRSQMIAQREHSKPLRWHDVNRIDPLVADQIMRGAWQSSIPVNGNGSQAIGEVARASYPREEYEFDRLAKADLRESWSLGDNQISSFSTSGRSASEAAIIQANFGTRIGYERAIVQDWFLRCAKVLVGLMALYDEIDYAEIAEDDMARMQTWDRTQISHHVVLSIRPDSTVLLDAQQEMARLERFLNLTAKSGVVDIVPVIRKMAELSGLDPDAVVRIPAPPEPEKPNISFRFSGEDLKDPAIRDLLIGHLVKTDVAPNPSEVQAGKALSLAGSLPLIPPSPTPSPGMGPVQGNFPDWNTAARIDRRGEGSERA